MSVRLLLDENLSERLLPLISDRFQDSRHVRLLGLGGADDLAIGERARCDADLLVTKDEDFLRGNQLQPRFPSQGDLPGHR